MTIFPFMKRIEDQLFLIIGDGRIAQRELQLVLQFTDRAVMITDREPEPVRREQKPEPGNTDREPEPVRREQKPESGNRDLEHGPAGTEREPAALDRTADPLFIGNAEKIRVIRRKALPSDLEEADYCVASTDDKERNRRIAELCLAKGIPVNVPDDPELCTFFFPSVIKRGDLVIAFSTGGKSPALAARLRRRFEADLPEDIEQILDRMGELRSWVPGCLSGSGDRAELYGEILDEMLGGQLPPREETVRARAMEMMNRYQRT